jgi:hypothetical protein
MTIEMAGGWQRYAGAYAVRKSGLPPLRVGHLVEFGAYEDGLVWVYDLETGDHPAEPLADVTVEQLDDGRWVVRRAGQLLLELDAQPEHGRTFELSRGAQTVRRWLRHPFRPPEIVSLNDLFDRTPASDIRQP